jgi:hypothetical protein
MKSILLKVVYSFLILGSFAIHAQSLVDDANLSSSFDGSNVFAETIKIISNSKKIFILTNNNQQLGPGDFVSLALENKLAARALVAKTHQGQVGIKILKIYSLAQWGRLKRDLEVQIIKGDDTQFGRKPEKNQSQDQNNTARIRSEDDLYSSDVIVDDEVGIFDENKNRHIKPDNLVSLTGGFLDAAEVESRGGKVRTNEFGIGWAYQFTDNFFVEGLYGRAIIDNFPGDGQQTLVNHLTARIKYNIKGPLFTFFMPYVGYHTYNISSPDAGKTDNTIADNEQLDAIEALKKNGPVFGVTILRRLVPGWFIKADLGSDIINVGFAIEF